ncbi:MAG TPA: MerR family transcriptional regulator, partial [Gammaproteobacteria bacterium]|nr:MerR family transcriptional regulator [Gammaproteobacteria bacterium]
MKIGELAKLTDCSIQAIRYYEKEGLIASSARSGGNFRLYNQAAVQRLLFIKHCRSLNLPLCDIRQLLQLQDTPSAQCDQVNQM